MKTEIILYRANTVTNGKFANVLSGYGWSYTGTWVKGDGYITKRNTAAGILYQENLLIKGVVYRLRFKVTNRTTGTCSIKSLTGGSTHLSATANQAYELEFTAEGTDIRFDCDTTFNGSIQNVELVSVPNEFNLDLNGDEAIPFSFNIESIFVLQARKTAWSKTCEVPGTHHNNKAFSHIYKINSEGVFDPRKKARAIIKGAGMVVFDGVASLEGIKKFPNGATSYQLTFVGETFDIFNKLQGKTIRDMDFSAYDHEFNLSTISANWGLVSSAPYTGTIGYCTNGSYTPSLAQQTIDYTFPAVTAMGSHTVDGIARVKLTFASNHSGIAVGDEISIDGENNLLCGTHTIIEIPAANSIALHMAYAHLTSATLSASSVTKRTWLGKGYWYPLQDNGHYHRVLTSGTLQQSMIYTCISFKGVDNFSNIAKDVVTGAPIALSEGVTFMADDGISAPMANITPTTWSSGSEISVYTLPSADGYLTNKNVTINKWHPMDLIPHIFVREVWTKMVDITGYDITCDIVDTPLFKRLVMPLDQKIDIEDTLGSPVPVIHMNDWLPGMKLADFFSSILNLFNLVIIEDKEVRNHLTLVSRNTFYDSGDVVTWQLDAGQALNIKLSNTILPKYYQLKYKTGTDFFNKDYEEEIGDLANSEGLANDIDRKYGDHYEGTGNDFSEKGNKVELQFEPTVMAGPMAGYYGNSDKTISVTYHADADGANITRKSAFRILIAGFRGTDDDWHFVGSEFSLEQQTPVKWTGYVDDRIYPYAAHIDNVYDGIPYHDLNFGTLLGQYFPYSYDDTAWSANTMVGKYWTRHLNQIIGRDSRHVTGTFKLSIKDIYDLDFRNEVRPEGCDFLLRLQRVVDWNLNGDGVCLCEFLAKI